jgi:DNA primase
MRKLIEAASPMVTLLWRRETEGKIFDSPERKAALDRDLRAVIGKIADPSIRDHYRAEIAGLRRALFAGAAPRRSGKPWTPGSWRNPPPAPAMAETRGTLLATAGAGAIEEVLREAVILATLITHPDLIESFESAFERIDMATDDHRELQRLILAHAHDHSPDLRARLERDAGPHLIEKLFALNHVQIAPSLRRADDAELAAMCLAEELAKLDAARGARRELVDAEQDITALADEGLTWRLGQAAKARDAAARGKGEDKGLFDRADNGVMLAREEKQALEALLKQIDYAKSARKPG